MLTSTVSLNKKEALYDSGWVPTTHIGNVNTVHFTEVAVPTLPDEPVVLFFELVMDVTSVSRSYNQLTQAYNYVKPMLNGKNFNTGTVEGFSRQWYKVNPTDMTETAMTSTTDAAAADGHVYTCVFGSPLLQVVTPNKKRGTLIQNNPNSNPFTLSFETAPNASAKNTYFSYRWQVLSLSHAMEEFA